MENHLELTKIKNTRVQMGTIEGKQCKNIQSGEKQTFIYFFFFFNMIGLYFTAFAFLS